MYFLLFRIFEQLALALKYRVALKMFTVFKYLLSFRIFEQLVLALKTEFTLKIFNSGGRPPPRPPASYVYGCTSSVGMKGRLRTYGHAGLLDHGVFLINDIWQRFVNHA